MHHSALSLLAVGICLLLLPVTPSNAGNDATMGEAGADAAGAD